MSILKVNAIQDTGGIEKFLATAWLNYNGATNTIRDSGNVSSVTDNGTGDFTVNFATVMDTVNYSVANTVGRDGASTSLRNIDIETMAVGSVRINSVYVSSTVGRTTADNTIINIAIHGGR